MLPLLLFPLNLINHFKKHQTGLPQWSYSFLVTIVPIVIVLLVPALREELLAWPEFSTGFGLAVLVWYALIAVAFVLDIRRNKELQERVMREGQSRHRWRKPINSAGLR